MAKIAVSAEILSEMMFRFADKPVEIVGFQVNTSNGEFIFEIEGEGVPQAENVQAMFTKQTNRAGEILHTMRFEPV